MNEYIEKIKQADKKKLLRYGIITIGLVILLIIYSLSSSKSNLEAEVQKNEEKISSLNLKINFNDRSYKDLNEKYEKKEIEYSTYKTKMEPYEELELAEAETQKAQLQKEKEEAEKQQEEAKKKEKEEAAKAEAAKKEKEEAEAAEKKKQEDKVQAELEAEEAKGYETGTTFDQLARTPDDYLMTKVKFSGKVIQVMEGDGYTQVRFAVNDNYDTIILAEISLELTDNNRILEDDYVTLSGYSMGLLTYESTLGGEITIPSITVEKIER